jgi:hypothetical protein
MALTAGLNIACEARSGGVKTIWLANRDDITSFTLTGSLYSAVTMVGVAVFFKFEFEQDTAERRESVVRENGSIAATHEVEFFVPKMSQANRDAISEIIDGSACGVVAIVEDANGTMWVDGYSENYTLFRALKLTSDEALSGKALTDLNGDTVIISSIDNEKSRTFTGTVPV